MFVGLPLTAIPSWIIAETLNDAFGGRKWTDARPAPGWLINGIMALSVFGAYKVGKYIGKAVSCPKQPELTA
jgi:hypothetical protein